MLHGFTDNYNFVGVKPAFVLFFLLLGITIFLALIFFLIYKNSIKASVAAFAVMAYNLFFGNIHDFLKSIFSNSFIVKYVFILPAAVIIFLLFFILLKKSKKNFTSIVKYLNLLFLLFILIDVVSLSFKASKKRNTETIQFPAAFVACDSCFKPDIYLIVADEYANSRELKDILHFDNTPFEKELSDRGFHVIKNSKSNYNATPFSIASMMTMNYLDKIGNMSDKEKINLAYEKINQNVLTQLLHQQGYEIINNSVFHFNDIPNAVNSVFFIQGTDLFTSQTLIGRLNRDLRFNLLTRFKIKSELKKFIDIRKKGIETLINKTVKAANSKSDKPRFIYLHTMMPHFPYIMDKDGNPDYTSYLETGHLNQAGYIGYLQYSNKIFLDLIDKIQSASPKAIIIFMGDHGFRHFEGNNAAHFMSFNSIYLPGKNYGQFYDSVSNVNEFRILFNTQFNQKFPILKDSTIFIKNWW